MFGLMISGKNLGEFLFAVMLFCLCYVRSESLFRVLQSEEHELQTDLKF